MSDIINNGSVNPEEMENTNIVVLNDEDGNEVEFEFLDVIPYEGVNYIILLPLDEEEAEVVILQYEGEDGDEETYGTVESEEILFAVFDLFKEKYREEFNFTDED